MKIIDLYVMVAKGEQPQRFKYKNRWFTYSDNDREFRSLKEEICDGDYPEYVYLSEVTDLSNLNDDVIMYDEVHKLGMSAEDFQTIAQDIADSCHKIKIFNKNKFIEKRGIGTHLDFHYLANTIERLEEEIKLLQSDICNLKIRNLELDMLNKKGE